MQSERFWGNSRRRSMPWLRSRCRRGVVKASVETIVVDDLIYFRKISTSEGIGWDCIIQRHFRGKSQRRRVHRCRIFFCLSYPEFFEEKISVSLNKLFIAFLSTFILKNYIFIIFCGTKHRKLGPWPRPVQLWPSARCWTVEIWVPGEKASVSKIIFSYCESVQDNILHLWSGV